MYKVVIVGGKLRGQEFILEKGDNVFGRSDECAHVLELAGVSKKHMNIVVNSDETVFVEDLGSSNGTFVEGKMVKRTSLKKNSKIAIPNAIFQLVYVAEKKVVIKKKVIQAEEEEVDFDAAPPMPPSPVKKILHLFRYKLMPLVYGFNQQYEWRVIFAILLFAFIATTIGLVIGPVLQSSKNLLQYEVSKRAQHYAQMISRLNASALQRKNLDRLDTGFLANADGVVSYELFDLDGRIVSPVEKLNKYINDSFSIYAQKLILAAVQSRQGYSGSVVMKSLGGGEIGVAQGVAAYDLTSGIEKVVGIIAIRFKPASLAVEAAKSTQAYLESLVTACLVGIIFFGVIYFLTIRFFDEMKFQIEECLRGKRKGLESSQLMTEANPLRNSINSLIQRVRELQNDDSGGFDEVEEEGPYIRVLEEVFRGSSGPTVVLNAEKNIVRMNTMAEDLLGIRETASIDASLLDTFRDQGLAATLIDLCDNSANSEGQDQVGTYEITGDQYELHVMAMIGRDSFAKAFLLNFMKAE